MQEGASIVVLLPISVRDILHLDRRLGTVRSQAKENFFVPILKIQQVKSHKFCRESFGVVKVEGIPREIWVVSESRIHVEIEGKLLD